MMFYIIWINTTRIKQLCLMTVGTSKVNLNLCIKCCEQQIA